MKISIIFDISIIFGDLARTWAGLLNSKGHEVTLIETGFNWEKAYDKHIDSDINLIIAGIFIMRVLQKHGFPIKGENILWIFEPLNDKSIMHHENVDRFNMIAHNFKRIIGMNQDNIDYAHKINKKIKTCIIPYNIAEQRIIEPIHEMHKIIDLVFIGHQSPKRNTLIKNLHNRYLNILYINNGCFNEKRSLVLSNTRISIQVAMDDYIYFDQFRIFESVAHGCLVVTERLKNMQNYGFIDRKNIVECDFEEIPAICEELLQKPIYRLTLIREAQRTLRMHYCSENFLTKLLDFIQL